MIGLWARLSLTAALAAPAVKLNRSVTPENPGLGEIVRVIVTIDSGNAASIEPPEFPNVPGLQYMGTSTGTEMRSTYVGGRFETKQTRSYTYQLVAQKKGEFKIPSLPFKVDGYTFRTDEARVKVSDRVAGGGGGRGRARPNPFGSAGPMDDVEELFNRMLQRPFGNPDPPARPAPRHNPDGIEQKPTNPDDAFFIQATTDKTKAFVGEQIVTNFYLVTRGLVRDIDTLRYPDLKGFWKEDLEMATRLNFENVEIDGVPYQRALLVSYALFPIHAGHAVIDGYKAKCTVLTPTTLGLGHAYQFTKASQPINMEIAELPQPKPADFTGAVGQFHLSAAFDPNVGAVNTPVTLRVRFEGQGNAKLIELPKLKLPDGFEIFETKSQAKFAKDGSSFKEFQVLIIPRQPGRFTIDPVQVSTFDPKLKTYAVVKSAPLELTVTGVASAPAASDPTAAVAAPKAAPKPEEPVVPELAGEIGAAPWPTAVWWTISGVVYALGLLGAAIGSRRALKRRPRRTSLLGLTRARVAKARALGAEKEWRRVGVELTNSVYFILGQLSDQGGANLELERLLERLPPSLRGELGPGLRDLLARLETLSFAPDAVAIEFANAHQIERLLADFETIVGRAIELAEI